MGRHGIEWEHKGTHEKHLSVLDYKKQEREKEVIQLEGQISEKKEEFQALSDRVENYDKGCLTLRQNTSCQSRRGSCRRSHIKIKWQSLWCKS